LQHTLVLAAAYHDLGKKRELWQRSIGNPNSQDCYAKSGKGWRPCNINDSYRHEFGSLLDAEVEAEFQRLNDEQKDMVLYLVAAHHGRGRPHFAREEVFDPEPNARNISAIAAEVPRRFARTQRRYGRWGLAYLESLLRAADYAASANPSQSDCKQ
jgi:CRISPR-associated endonuclease/helicase Cas3